MAVAHLTWTAGGGLEQEVWYKEDDAPTFTLYATVSGSTDSIDIPDLDPNSVYVFEVINKCGFGIQQTSGQVEMALVTCPELTVYQAALSLTVEFPDLGGDIDEYLIECFELPSETLVGSFNPLAGGGVAAEFSSLTPDTYYRIRVTPIINDTFENDTCEVEERTLGCSEGYTLAPDGSYCYLIEEVAADPPMGGTPENTEAATHASYGNFGTYIYDPGYSVDGTGTSTQITPSNAFWINDGSTTSDGPLNRCGLWSESALSDQDIGFAVCLDLPETDVYYIGIGGDNRCRIVIDGVVIVDQNVSALATQYSTDAQVTFKIWHVYPVTLSAGPHFIELIGHNDSGVAALGAEIYNNTSAEIIAATDYTGLNMVFSTLDHIGQPVQLGSDDVGYTCPTGYSLAACEDPVVCQRILTELPS